MNREIQFPSLQSHSGGGEDHFHDEGEDVDGGCDGRGVLRKWRLAERDLVLLLKIHEASLRT